MKINLTTEKFAPPEFDTAVSTAVLRRVSDGVLPSTFRIWVPARIVAFGRSDRTRPGYQAAVKAVRKVGFTPIERLAGGKAAVFHEGTIAFAWALPEDRPRETIEARFDETTAIVMRAFESLGVDARIGEVEGEYCPGRFSVNARGVRKLMGVGQRLVRDAAHVGGVIVVSQPELVNEALIPAYRHLGYDWEPETTGALADEVDVDVAQTANALRYAIEERHSISSASLDQDTLDLAQDLVADHSPTSPIT